MMSVALELDGDPLLHVGEIGPSNEAAPLVPDDVLRNRPWQPVSSNETSEPNLQAAGVRGGMWITDIEEPPHGSDPVAPPTSSLLEPIT